MPRDRGAQDDTQGQDFDPASWDAATARRAAAAKRRAAAEALAREQLQAKAAEKEIAALAKEAAAHFKEIDREVERRSALQPPSAKAETKGAASVLAALLLPAARVVCESDARWSAALLGVLAAEPAPSELLVFAELVRNKLNDAYATGREYPKTQVDEARAAFQSQLNSAVIGEVRDVYEELLKPPATAKFGVGFSRFWREVVASFVSLNANNADTGEARVLSCLFIFFRSAPLNNTCSSSVFVLPPFLKCR